MQYIGKQPPATPSSFTAVASGAISDGDSIVINTNGTVAKVFESFTNTVPPTLGSNSSGLPSVTGSYTSSTATNGSDTVIHVFDGTSGYPSVIAGTVGSGNATPSYGSAVVLNSTAGKYMSGAIYIGSNKWVISYSYGSDKMSIRVVTVSGTTVSLGSEKENFAQGLNHSIAHDTAENQFLFTFRNTGASNVLSGVIFTVSGTTVTLSTGDITTIESDAVEDGTNPLGVSYDTNADRFVVIYKHGSTAVIYARVINNANKSLTIGSRATVVSASGGNGDNNHVTYENINKKILIAYAKKTDVDATNYRGFGRVGTVNAANNTIALGTEAAITPVGTGFYDGYISPDNTNGKILVSYRTYVVANGAQNGNINIGTISGTDVTFAATVIYQSGDTRANSIASFGDGRGVVFGHPSAWVSRTTTYGVASANLTSENFIGFSDGGYVNGADASVFLSGSITKAQSSLTAGQQYFVQGDGTLATTADSISVIAGTAISATELIVKG